MKDVKKLLRMAYYSLLNGNLTAGAYTIKVSEGVALVNDSNAIYVLLVSGKGVSQNTQQSWMMEEEMRIDIIGRGSRFSMATIDDIGNQVLSLVLPTPQTNGLGNSQIINCRVTDDRNLPLHPDGAVNVVRRMITFTQLIAQ